MEQHDKLGEDEAKTSQHIRDYLRDPQRDISEPCLTLNEVSIENNLTSY